MDLAKATIKLKSNMLTRLELDDLSSYFFPLARNIARRFAKRGEEDEYTCAGYEGIAYAMRTASDKMYDENLEKWVKSCIYRFIRNHRVTDHLVCTPNTTLREARARGEVIECMKRHSLLGNDPATPKNNRYQELLDFLDKAATDQIDVEIIQLRQDGYTDTEIGELTGKSKSDIHRRRIRMEKKFNSFMGVKECEQ